MPSHTRLTAALAVATLATPSVAQCSQFANNPPGINLFLIDEGQRTVGLPFPFMFNGVNYSTITVSSNGFLWLGSGGANDYTPSIGEATTDLPRIIPMWLDLDPKDTDGVYYDTDGVSRANVIWKNVPEYANPSSQANFEVILESSGKITFYYDSSNGTPNGAVVVGISGGGISNQPVTTSWVTNYGGASGITFNGVNHAATALEAYGGGLFPLNNLVPGAGTTIEIIPQGSDPQHRAFDAIGLPNHTTCPPSTILASSEAATTIGTPCPAPRTTIHEQFTPTAGTNPFDLAGTSLLFLRSGDSYTLAPGIGFDSGYNTPGRGTILPGVTDDSVVPAPLAPMTFPFGTRAPLTQVTIGSNGYIWLPTGAAEVLPDARIVTSNSRIAAFWTDLVPDSLGSPIYWEATPAFCMATWENVPAYLDGGSYTFQIRLLVTGDIAVSYGTMTGNIVAVRRAPIVGLAGGVATQLGSLDLATNNVVNPITRQITGLVSGTPPIHTLVQPARLGQLFVLNSTAPSNNLGTGIFGVGLGNPNLPLDQLFGIGSAPGCTIYTDASQDFFFPVAFPVGAPAFTLTAYAPVPVLLFLQGLQAYTQAAVLTPPGAPNAAGLVTSNGLRFRVGF